MKLPTFFNTIKNYAVNSISQLLTTAKFIKDNPKILISLLPLLAPKIAASDIFVETSPTIPGALIRDAVEATSHFWGYNHTSFINNMVASGYKVYKHMPTNITCGGILKTIAGCRGTAIANCGNNYNEAFYKIVDNIVDTCLVNPLSVDDMTLICCIAGIGAVGISLGIFCLLNSETCNRCHRHQPEEENPLMPRLEP